MNFINYSNNKNFYIEKQNISKDKFYQNSFLNSSETSTNNDYNLRNINDKIITKGIKSSSYYHNKKKRVKFNENIDVILIRSFKRYNKQDDEDSIADYFDKNFNYRPKNRKKEELVCQCNII